MDKLIINMNYRDSIASRHAKRRRQGENTHHQEVEEDGVLDERSYDDTSCTKNQDTAFKLSVVHRPDLYYLFSLTNHLRQMYAMTK